MRKKTSNALWKIRSLKSGHERQEDLFGYWEVEMDPMSSDFTPAEISAFDLFLRWAGRVRAEYPDGLVPILWFVGSPTMKVEFMPFQFQNTPLSEDFLTHFTWPTNAATGDALNWLALPVIDKVWNRKRADKGGFIQEATGWKPSILQPFVFLPSLIESARR